MALRRRTPAVPDAPATPEALFTPNTTPDHRVWQPRTEVETGTTLPLQERVSAALRDIGSQLLIYGETGVGKTSLVREMCRDLGIDPLYVVCQDASTFESLVHTAAAQLIAELPTKRTAAAGSAAYVGADLGNHLIAKLSSRLTEETSSTAEYTAFERPMAELLTGAMTASGRSVVILDNYQNVTSEAARRAVSDFADTLANTSRENGNLKVVLVTVAENTDSVRTTSNSAYRRFRNIFVPRMDRDAIAALLRRALSYMGLTADGSAIERITYYSDGLPYFAHLIARNAAERSLRYGIDFAGLTVDEAAQEEARDLMAGYKADYEIATRGGGELRVRYNALLLLTRDSRRSWSTNDVQNIWEQSDDVPYVSNIAKVSQALGQLASPTYGGLLRRTEKPAMTYLFADSLLKSVLRMQDGYPII